MLLTWLREQRSRNMAISELRGIQQRWQAEYNDAVKKELSRIEIRNIDLEYAYLVDRYQVIIDDIDGSRIIRKARRLGVPIPLMDHESWRKSSHINHTILTLEGRWKISQDIAKASQISHVSLKTWIPIIVAVAGFLISVISISSGPSDDDIRAIVDERVKEIAR